MKSILLASTAIVAFAGAAAAEVSFSGSAALGYNDTDGGDNYGFYSDMNLDVSMSAELDNGITVTATADVDELDASDEAFGGVTLSIASETASLTYGDTDPSADKHWSGVDGDTTAGFNDRDAHLDGDDAPFDAIIRAEATLGAVTASLSYGVDVQAMGGTDLDAMQLAAVADLGGFTVVAAYQEALGDTDDVIGLSAATTLGGADVMGSYLTDGVETSTGVSVSYPVGAVTLGGYYSMNDVADDNWGVSADYAAGALTIGAEYDSSEDWSIEGTYDMGNGLELAFGTVAAGDDYYVAGNYDLGGGASLLVSYVEDGGTANADDEIGAGDYQAGTTVEVSFSF